MRVAARFFATPTPEQIVPFAYVASIVSREMGATVHAMACKPFWEYALGELVIGRTVTESIDFEVALDEETLKLHRQSEIRRYEEVFNFLTKLWRFFDRVKMLVPVLRRICK